MALNLKLADAYVDLSLRTQQFDSGYAGLMSKLKNLPVGNATVNLNTTRAQGQINRLRADLGKLGNVSINLRMDRGQATANLGLLRQQIQALKGLGGAIIPIRADMRQWNRSIVRMHVDLQRVKTAALIPVRANTNQAHVNLSHLLSLVRQIQMSTRFRFTGQRQGWWPGRGSGGGGGGASFGGGGGPGFLSGVWSGAGMPFAANPQMMAGELASKALIDVVKTSADLESEFGTLRRITGMTAEQMASFESTIMEMGTTRPGVATSDLISMAQIGARMGVTDKGGLPALKQFTEQLAEVKLAIPDMQTENLANQISRTLNVFDLGTDRIKGFGSALVAMDNISTASASDILAITQRISGFAKSANMTLPQVLALSSVLKDVGLTNEVAGSAVSRIMSKMVTNWHELAETVGVDSAKFKDAIQRDPLEALQMVIEKFGELKDTVGKQEFLAEIGLKNSRDLAAFQQLAPKFGEVSRRTKIAAEETGTTASLDKAQKIKGEETNASFTRAGNSLTSLKKALGEKVTPAASMAADALGDVAAAFATIIRGKTRVNFSGPREVAAQALPALDATNKPVAAAPKKPTTVEEAKAAFEAADAKNTEVGNRAEALQKLADKQGFESRDMMRQAATKPELILPAEKAMQEAAETKRQAQAAAEESAKAFAARQQAWNDHKDARAEQNKKDDVNNKLFDVKNRFMNTLGAVGDAKKSLLGIGVKTAAAVIGPGDDERRTASVATIGSSASDAGRRIQEDILRSRPNSSADKTEKNTRDAVGLLGELKDILARNANQVGGAVLAR
ncbi:phage tail tape measure protein [Singulisphaera sp. PoT]|uniref:phage tail tape measure protein n=1 Tax=Singulisphaera sp. PoT TaxID=3411797 RepID=UPI003BF4C45E